MTPDEPTAPMIIKNRASTILLNLPSKIIPVADAKAPGANNSPVCVAVNPSTL